MTKLERNDEASEYFDVIMVAIKMASSRQPMGSDVGAVIGALVSVLAYFLAGVRDEKLLHSMIKEVGAALVHEIEARRKAGHIPTIERIKKGRPS